MRGAAAVRGAAAGLGAVLAVGEHVCAEVGASRIARSGWRSARDARFRSEVGGRDKCMLNDGYGSRVRKREADLPKIGRKFRCPNCGKILMEAVAEKIKTRCKHCGKWVYIYKKGSGVQGSKVQGSEDSG